MKILTYLLALFVIDVSSAVVIYVQFTKYAQYFFGWQVSVAILSLSILAVNYCLIRDMIGK